MVASSVLKQLKRAIARNDAHTVLQLLKDDKLSPDEWIGDDSLGAPLLVLATRHGARAIVELLLDRGADIHDVDHDGRTACHAAAETGDVLLLDLLHRRGADLNMRDYVDATPLQVAAYECEDERSAKRLIELGASLEGEDVQFALAGASRGHIQLLIDAGIDVGALHNPNLGTPLHWVRSDRDLEATLDKLVNVYGFDVNARDYKGDTCCHNAVTLADSDETLRWLIDAGADFDVVNVDHETPLLQVVNRLPFRGECMRILLAAGANVHARWGDNSALYLAAGVEPFEEAVEAVHLLLAAGADLDAANDRGITPRELLSECDNVVEVDPAQIEAARRSIAKTRLNFVRERAVQVCIGLQSLRLDALQLCEILQFSCGRMASIVEFHQWWAIATTVKHFKRSKSHAHF